MEFKELIEKLESFKDTEDYNNYVGGFVTSDRVGKFLESDEGKKFIQPTLDKYHNKGLESWKTSSLPKLIDEEIKKRFPDKSEKDIELDNIKAELESIKSAKAREELTNKALKLATEKKLPVSLIDYFITDDKEETMINNLEVFEKTFTGAVTSLVDEKLKSGSYTPAGDDKNNENTDPFLQGLGIQK